MALGLYVRDLQHWADVARGCIAADATAPVDRAAGPDPAAPYRAELIALGVDVPLVLRRCGVAADSLGWWDGDRITLCTETTADPAFARFVLAHEAGHAVMAVEGLPYTGSAEVAADEYATVELLVAGDTAAISAAADWFWDHRDPEGREDPVDPHPSAARRALTIKCLELGYLNPPSACGRRFIRAFEAWSTLLGK